MDLGMETSTSLCSHLYVYTHRHRYTLTHAHNRCPCRLIFVKRLWLSAFSLSPCLASTYFVIHKQICHSFCEILAREAAGSTLTLTVRMQLCQLSLIEYPSLVNDLSKGSSACYANKALSCF